MFPGTNGLLPDSEVRCHLGLFESQPFARLAK
ncbi:hypothetical protein SAMN04488546_0045 [Geodermatophilus poikilotrophus]|uniref:Uncharacterized protein n=1 Tax=Geodermatophilus poikilotrophus TaxID=1333667 RepID=A0A1H9YDJ2_9ACTN|nr:hypothetical protein SAMN04488546_0045 [Geodermatophilus poikilotrophus]